MWHIADRHHGPFATLLQLQIAFELVLVGRYVPEGSGCGYKSSDAISNDALM